MLPKKNVVKNKYPKPHGEIKYEKLANSVNLIRMAADFYLLTAMKNLADMEQEGGRAFLRWRYELLKDLRELHTDTTKELEEIFLAYFLFAVCSELKHKSSIMSPREKIGNIVGNFLENIPKNEKEILKFLEKNVPTCKDAMSFFEMVNVAFGKLKWEPGFGGKKWERISNTAHMRLSGELDAVMFVDSAFDIQHHNGHIFDKHDSLNCNDEELNKLLAVKRDCTLSKTEKLIRKFASSYVRKLFLRGAKFDWWKEEPNGSS